MPGSKKSQVILSIVLLGALLCVGFVLWWFYKNTQVEQVVQPPPQTPVVQDTKTAEVEPASVEKTAEFDGIALQGALDTWSAGLGADSRASVVLMNIEGDTVASYAPYEEYFTASIYKLFVAYEGYRAVDAGEFDATEVYLNGKTRAECLDLMIRESDSPCAEKLWAELGKENITEIIKSYGIDDTSLVGLSTTAHDSALMTARIARGEGLSDSSQAAILESMKTQVFRDALNIGFSSEVTVYNKIGFNAQLEYHDVALVRLADGRELIVSVLTSGVGTKNIASLATLLEAAF